MSLKLSEGSLATIMRGDTVDSPVVQVLGNRKIGDESSVRYRLLISDGINVHSFVMLGTQLSEKVVSGELSNNTIIRVKDHITTLVNNAAKGKKRVMIILDLDVIAKGEVVGLKIGNPVPLKDDSNSENSSSDQSSENVMLQYGRGGTGMDEEWRQRIIHLLSFYLLMNQYIDHQKLCRN